MHKSGVYFTLGGGDRVFLTTKLKGTVIMIQVTLRTKRGHPDLQRYPFKTSSTEICACKIT